MPVVQRITHTDWWQDLRSGLPDDGLWNWGWFLDWFRLGFASLDWFEKIFQLRALNSFTVIATSGHMGKRERKTLIQNASQVNNEPNAKERLEDYAQ